MSLDLLEHVPDPEIGFRDRVGAAYLVARLCEEARVCLGDPLANRVVLHAATYSFDEGLRVTDADGKVYRLRVTRELVSLPPAAPDRRNLRLVYWPRTGGYVTLAHSANHAFYLGEPRTLCGLAAPKGSNVFPFDLIQVSCKRCRRKLKGTA